MQINSLFSKFQTIIYIVCPDLDLELQLVLCIQISYMFTVKLYATNPKSYVKYNLCFKYNMPNYISQIYVLSSTYVLYVLRHNNPLLPSHRLSYTICLKFMSRITTCVVSSNQLQIDFAQICLIQYSSQIQRLCVHLL